MPLTLGKPGVAADAIQPGLALPVGDFAAVGVVEDQPLADGLDRLSARSSAIVIGMARRVRPFGVPTTPRRTPPRAGRRCRARSRRRPTEAWGSRSFGLWRCCS